MEKSYLLLDEQLCFPMYATSRMITRLYQPWLDKLKLTYPQYLVMLVLWQHSEQTVGQLGKKLYLNTNTLTPLLKKMQVKGLIIKERSDKDERSVVIRLSESGLELKPEAEKIPPSLLESLNMSLEDLEKMRQLMWKFLSSFEKQSI